MKQEFLTVWQDGEQWFDFPATNEQVVQDMLMKKGVMSRCMILKQGQQPKNIPVNVIQQSTSNTKKK